MIDDYQDKCIYIRETIHRVHYSFIRTVTSDTVAGS